MNDYKQGRLDGLAEAARICEARYEDSHSPEASYCADDIRTRIEERRRVNEADAHPDDWPEAPAPPKRKPRTEPGA